MSSEESGEKMGRAEKANIVVNILGIEPVYGGLGHVEALKIRVRNGGGDGRASISVVLTDVNGREIGSGESFVKLKAGEEREVEVVISPAPLISSVNRIVIMWMPKI
jgi:hypothetical protein